MYPKTHIIFGIIFTSILVYFFNVSLFTVTIIFLASVLIDVDHYLYYVYKKKDFNLKRAFNWFVKREEKWNQLTKEQKKQYKHIHLIFHGIEFFLIIIILALIHEFFLWILIGITFHMFLDFTKMIYHKQPLHTKASQIYVFISNRGRKLFLNY